jgi:hypothetical protein
MPTEQNIVYKFEFSKTYEGLLRVRVKTDNYFECALAIYEDDRAFLRLVKRAGLPPENERSMERAVVLAFSPMSTGLFCEDLEVTQEQLTFLRLGMARQVHA